MDQTLTETLIGFTMEIIYLLTGEDFVVVKAEHLLRRTQSLFQAPPPSLTPKRNEPQKIVDVIYRMMALLTGEVPIRCQDVAVYLSMEERDYLEEHQDQYKAAMMEDLQCDTPTAEWDAGDMETSGDGPSSWRSDPRGMGNAALQDEVCGMNPAGHITTLKEAMGQDGFQHVTHPDGQPPTPGAKGRSAESGGHAPAMANLAQPPCTLPPLQQDEFSSMSVSNNLGRALSGGSLPVQIKEEPLPYNQQSPYGRPSCKAQPLHTTRIREEPELHQNAPGGESHDKNAQGEESHDANALDCPAVSNNLGRALSGGFLPVQIKEEPRSYAQQSPYGKPSCKAQPFHTTTRIKEDPELHQEGLPHPMGREELCDITQAASHPQTVPQPRVSSLEIFYNCPECPKFFRSNLELARHQVVHTRGADLPWLQARHEVDYPYVCAQCDTSFYTADFLAEHQKKHDEKAREKKTREKKSHDENAPGGESHAKNVPGGESHDKNAQGEQSHDANAPGGESHDANALDCPECGKRFPTRKRLTVHLKCHSDERPFRCPQCGDSFKKKHHMQRHHALHASHRQKIFCPQCGQSFKTKGALAAHRVVHAPARLPLRQETLLAVGHIFPVLNVQSVSGIQADLTRGTFPTH